MEKLLWANKATGEASGTLSAGGVTLVLSTGQGSRFPAPGAGEAFLVTIYELDGGSNEENIEVVKCTARTADTLTIVRDIEGNIGGGGYSYPTVPARTIYVALRMTALGAEQFLQSDQNLADIDNAATARTNLGTTAEAQAMSLALG